MGSGYTPDEGTFLFAKTNYYVYSIGVHCVKHDGSEKPMQ